MSKEPEQSRGAGRPTEKIRWTAEAASREFDLDRKTLAKRLSQAAIEPGADGRYSTAQIAAAVYGDLEREKIRDTAASADIREMERDERRRQLLETRAVKAAWLSVLEPIRRIIHRSNLLPREKEEIFRNLRELEIHDYLSEPVDAPR